MDGGCPRALSSGGDRPTWSDAIAATAVVLLPEIISRCVLSDRL